MKERRKCRTQDVHKEGIKHQSKTGYCQLTLAVCGQFLLQSEIKMFDTVMHVMKTRKTVSINLDISAFV